MIIKGLILAALIRLLIATDKPFLCSGLYASMVFVLGLVGGSKFVIVVISAGIAFGLASLYFWLLDRVEAGTIWWWVIALVGLAIGLV
jgi:4-amino-4-deoxy-L-arabinose transferase-like glycosyltransferase